MELPRMNVASTTQHHNSTFAGHWDRSKTSAPIDASIEVFNVEWLGVTSSEQHRLATSGLQQLSYQNSFNEAQREASSSESYERSSSPSSKDETDSAKKQKVFASDQESSASRAEQQRLASKRYRQKKKVLVEQLEAKMKVAVEEKAKIEQEYSASLELIEKLKKENSVLSNSRKPHWKEIEQYQQEKYEILVKMSTLCASKDARDVYFVPVLKQFHECCKKLKELGEFQPCFTCNTTAVSHFIRSGFYEAQHVTHLLHDDSRYGISHYTNRVVDIATLSRDQQEQVRAIGKECIDRIYNLREEREELNKEVTAFVLESNMGYLVAKDKTKDYSMPQLLQAMTSLELLRKNLELEVIKSEVAIEQVLSILTPTQQALFFVEVESQYKSILQLKKIWETMSGVTSETVCVM